MSASIRVEFVGRDNAVYEPGEKVSGEIFVENPNELNLKEIKARFRGKAHNSWYDHARKSCYSAKEYYIDENVSIYPEAGSSKEILPAGKHQFPFSFSLPQNAPCTFEGAVGWVRYTVYATIDIPTGKDIKTMAHFTVLPKTDLNLDEKAKVVPTVKIDTKVGFLRPKPFHIVAHSDKGGYAPGETIVITIEMNNKSNDDVTIIRASLEQKSKFTGGWGEMAPCVNTFTKKSNAAKIKEKCFIAKQSEGKWIGKLIVPSIPPSDLPGCTIIDIMFRLQLKIKCGLGITCKLPIRIGTIPLRSANDETFCLPTYEESVFGSVDTKEEDKDFMGNTSYTPVYTFYDMRKALLKE